ncbi:MAG: PepSY domain-containing protein [Phycisphaerales bacterium]|nr:PepSY domain-containing protein [Phycisphaerales bacterium]
MRIYKFFRTAHKWTGIVLALMFVTTASTGFLLLVKKKMDWIQPPTREDKAGEIADCISTQQLFEVVLAQRHPDFQSLEDIDRVDFRPGKRVFKVRSVHHYSELQVGAVTGEVLNSAKRRSDFLEEIHDGSFLGEWAHGYLMPLTACALVFLTFSGLWLWIEPIIRQRMRLKKRAGPGEVAEVECMDAR